MHYKVITISITGSPMVIEFEGGFRAGLGPGCLMVWKEDRGYEVAPSKKTAHQWAVQGLSNAEIRLCAEAVSALAHREP